MFQAGDIVKVINPTTHPLSIWKAEYVNLIGYITHTDRDDSSYSLVCLYLLDGTRLSFHNNNLQKVS
jgi:hypothetical protein